MSVDGELAAKLSRRMELSGDGGGGKTPLGVAGQVKETTRTTGVEAVSDSASAELKSRLSHRTEVNEGRAASEMKAAFAEFFDLPRGQLRRLETSFRRWDVDGDGRLGLDELKRMMETLELRRRTWG